MGKWKRSTEEDKKTWLAHSVSDKRRDRIIETKNKGDHVGLAIAYWLLPTTFALSHYCHVGNHKSFFKVESEVIKDVLTFYKQLLRLLKHSLKARSEVLTFNIKF